MLAGDNYFSCGHAELVLDIQVIVRLLDIHDRKLRSEVRI